MSSTNSFCTTPLPSTIPAPTQQEMSTEPHSGSAYSPVPLFNNGLDAPVCSSSNASVFGPTPSSLSFDVNHVKQLETEILKLRCQVAELQGYQRGVQDSYIELVKACPQALALTKNPFSLPIPTATCTSKDPATTATDELASLWGKKPYVPYSVGDQAKCPGVVKYWVQEDWTSTNEKDTDKLTTADSTKKKSKRGQVNTTAKYITDEAGEPVDGARLKIIRDVLRGLWQDMPSPATTWATGTSETTRLRVYVQLATVCPEIGQCADNWKAKALCTYDYPGWIRSVVALKVKTEVKEEAEIKDSKSMKRKRPAGEDVVVQGEDGLSDLPPIKRTNLASDYDGPADGPSTEPMVVDSPSLTERTSAEGTDLAAKVVSMPKLPTSANTLFKAGRRKIEPKPVVDQDEPLVPILASQLATCAAAEPASPISAEETLVPLPPSFSQPIRLNVPGNPVPYKKPYNPSKTSTTSRGLCALDWVSQLENKGKTVEEFDAFWEGTVASDKTLKMYWEERSAAAQTSRQKAVASTDAPQPRKLRTKVPAMQKDV
ncbi:hypothetical protein DL96DRAFT_1814169 [Flagelloscypha sp. PMI_526]|nr:hypothetical protein DL96DRAFT_1814169 [Flagelloscypha sp. PMI_526]